MLGFIRNARIWDFIVQHLSTVVCKHFLLVFKLDLLLILHKYQLLLTSNLLFVAEFRCSLVC